MRTFTFNLMGSPNPSSSIDLGASSCIPGSSTLAAGARFPILFPYIATSSLASPPIPNPGAFQNIEYGVGYNVEVAFTGSPVGFWQLCSTNNYIDATPIAGSSTPVVTGSSGVIVWNVDRAYYKAVQLQFVPNVGSTAQLIRADISSKGWA